MAVHLSDTVPAPTLFKYLTADTLTGVACDDRTNVYSYECGCTAIRLIDSVDCFVRWCDTHRPEE